MRAWLKEQKANRNGQVAQLVEQRTENPRVGGSIPSLATKNSPTCGTVTAAHNLVCLFVKPQISDATASQPESDYPILSIAHEIDFGKPPGVT
jgi:hypothetical protein